MSSGHAATITARAVAQLRAQSDREVFMEPIMIERQDCRTRGSYVATIPGIPGIARLDHKREQPDLVIAERTKA